MKSKLEPLIFSLLVLAVMGVVPNLFAAAQAGYAKFSVLGKYFLIPSVLIMVILIPVIYVRGFHQLTGQIMAGLGGGLLGTLGLEVVRHSGFLLGGMPGELPKLMGVLLLDQFAQGPDIWSNLAGWGYHFWTGAAFGIIYTLLFGKGSIVKGIGYGVLIGIGFMASPAALSLGVGLFGANFGWGFPLTVTLAHVAFGGILGFFVKRKIQQAPNILDRVKTVYSK
ncbi:MAG TPA: hypothetical protein ENN22_06800 [bacterium]|nr:hypothetical protein [bacterium]